MKKFYVNCTMIYNGTIEVCANSESDAFEIVDDILSNNTSFPKCIERGDVSFDYGETTIDYADEI